MKIYFKTMDVVWPYASKIFLIMRLIAFFILVNLTYVSAKSYGQQISVNVQNASIEDVLRLIEKQSSYHFLFKQDDLSPNEKVNLVFKRASIAQVLDECLRGKSLIYTIIDQTIVLKRSPELIKSNSAIVEPIKVQGKITDNKGIALPGVSIQVKGTSIGTTSDNEGRYVLNNVDKGAVLIYSYIGFAVQERTVENSGSINITLLETINSMNEVVVIGYGTVQRKDLTGSVSSLKPKDITAIPTSNVIETLQGKIPGMDIRKSTGQAGAGLSVNLRGTRSLTASNDPLILVDGISYGSSLDLNATDIASVEVLKDASSTAIYGSRGANGVILITTKRGKSGKPMITLSSFYGPQSPAGLAKIQTGDQFAAFKREAFKTAGITDDNLIFNPGELDAIKNRTYTDWQQTLIKDGWLLNNELGISGGTEKSTFNMSFGNYREHGLFKNDDLNRYNGSLGLNYQLFENVKIGVNGIYTFKNNNQRSDPLNQANKIYPFGSPYDADGNIVLYPVLGQSFALSPLADEVPGAYVDNRKGKRLFVTSYINWEILKGLTFRSTYGLDISNDRRGYFMDKYTLQQNGNLSTSGVTTNATNNYTWENTLTYNKNLGKHDFNFLLGNSYIINSLETLTASGNDQVSAQNTFNNLGSNSSSVLIGSSLVESNLASYFGRVNYKFDNKYLITATLRGDGSSVLAAGHKWAYFPSVALGWRLKEENFLKNFKQLSNLKLRGSYGISGNSSVLPYATLGSLGRSIFAFDETAAYGYYPKDITNPDLKWEKTATANLGLDFGLFNDRITGSVELYQSKTSDLLLQRILPATSGFSSTLQNVGKTQNRGLEISISSINLAPAKSTGLKWSTDFTYSLNQEKIVELAGGVDRDLANSWFVGHATQVYYDFKKVGIWQSNEEAAAAIYGQKPGDIKVLDVNNDQKITADDRIIVGSARPKYTFGLNNTWEYQHLDLTVFLYGRVGQTILNEASGNYKINGLENGPAVDYWTPDNPTNDHPRPDKDKTSNSAFMSTLYYANGSFLKVRDITLGYTLPAAFAGRVGMSKIRFYGTMKNFFTFSHIGSYDPERGGALSFPITKQVVFGLNLSL